VIQEIDSESLKARLDAAEGLLLLDIRTAGEVAQGAIPGATEIPMHLIPLRQTEIPKNQDVVLYCRSGARSYQACTYLAEQGFSRVINLRGGIVAWARHGFPIALPASHRAR
jgi:rhodanese-related sulfurtransferase